MLPTVNSRLLLVLFAMALSATTSSAARADDCARVTAEAQEAFNRFFERNQKFKVTSKSGNVYSGDFLREDAEGVYFRDAMTGRETAIRKNRLNLESLEGQHFSGEGVQFQVRSKSGNTYGGKFVAETTDHIFYRDPKMPGQVSTLFKTRLDMGTAQEASKSGFFKDEVLTFVSDRSGNVYKGKFISENGNVILITDESGNVIRLESDRVTRKIEGRTFLPPKPAAPPVEVNPFPSVPARPSPSATTSQMEEWARKVLGVERNFSAADVEKAYRGNLKFHPDRWSGDPRANSYFKEVNEAREILRRARSH